MASGNDNADDVDELAATTTIITGAGLEGFFKIPLKDMILDPPLGAAG